ncbi:hypothetical protein [Pseudomonas sp. LB3P58]|jgi:hypothetical protein|nr:Uncharacterised protein [Pseudomonas fluorescens]
MATLNATKDRAYYADIQRLQQANVLMRAANQALVQGDDAALQALGFSASHIAELRQRGGFRASAIGQNTRMISRLRREVTAHDQ